MPTTKFFITKNYLNRVIMEEGFKFFYRTKKLTSLGAKI